MQTALQTGRLHRKTSRCQVSWRHRAGVLRLDRPPRLLASPRRTTCRQRTPCSAPRSTAPVQVRHLGIQLLAITGRVVSLNTVFLAETLAGYTPPSRWRARVMRLAIIQSAYQSRLTGFDPYLVEAALRDRVGCRRWRRALAASGCTWWEPAAGCWRWVGREDRLQDSRSYEDVLIGVLLGPGYSSGAVAGSQKTRSRTVFTPNVVRH